MRKARRRVDIERDPELVGYVPAQLHLDALGARGRRRVGRQEDRGDEILGVVAAAAHDAAHGLANEQVDALDGGVRGENKPGNVDSLADHVDRDPPARCVGASTREAIDPSVGAASSLTTTTGFSPVIVRSSFAVAGRAGAASATPQRYSAASDSLP